MHPVHHSKPERVIMMFRKDNMVVKSRESANYSPQATPAPLLVFINEVLLVHSHTPAWTYGLWLLFYYKQSSSDKNRLACKTRNIGFLAPYRCLIADFLTLLPMSFGTLGPCDLGCVL